MKKTKIVLLGLCSVAMMSLASCGSKNVSYSDVGTKINIWATAAEEEVIKTVVDNYNANQTDDTAKFSYEFTAVSESDAGTTLAKDPLVTGAPALFLCADDHIFNLASKDIVLELKGTYKENITSNNSSVAVTGATYNDHIYGYPVTSDNGYFLWYNNSELGDSDVSSLETLLATAKSKGKTVLMDVPNGFYVNSFFQSPAACGNTSLNWSADTTGAVTYTCDWDNDTGIKVASYINSVLQPYYEDGTLVIGSNEVILQGFQNDTMCAAVSGTWMEKQLSPVLGDKLAASKLPSYKIDGTSYQMASFTGSKVYSINKTRPVAEQKAAVALADLLTNEESQLIRFEKRASIPCNNNAIKNERYTKNVSIGAKALGEQNAYAAVQSQSAQDRYWDVGKAIGQALIDGKLGTYTDWSAFMKGTIAPLKKAA